MKRKVKTSLITFGFLLTFISFTQAENAITNLKVDSYTQGSISDSLKGKVKVDGLDYEVICDCFDENKQEEKTLLGPACDPSKLKLSEDKIGDGASYDDIRDLIGLPSELKYGNAAETPFYCLDGRIKTPVLGTLGGDAGEFILGLFVYKGLSGNSKELDQETVTSYLLDYLKYMKSTSFIMCTDDAALSHLGAEVSIEGLNLNNPRPSEKEDIISALIKPDNIGDSHIKMLIKYANLYSIDPDIVKKFIVAFYTILWDKENEFSKKLQLEILIGEHRESAFLEVRSNEACTKAQLAPLITPRLKSKDGLSIYVNHLDAASIKRIDIAKFFSNYIAHHQQGFDPEIFHNRMNHHALAFLETTGSFLAKNLPFYTINIV